MGNTDTSPLNDWVKRELIPALSAAKEVDKSLEFEVWKQGMLSGIALVSAQMEMEQVLDSDELFPGVFIAWLNDKKMAGVCDD